jgi:hypothetical protein
MKGFIKLTNLKDKQPIYINVDCIGHVYTEKPKIEHGRVEKEAHTVVGVTTHNNGGFQVIETPNEIFIMLEEFNLITI